MLVLGSNPSIRDDPTQPLPPYSMPLVLSALLSFRIIQLFLNGTSPNMSTGGGHLLSLNDDSYSPADLTAFY